MQRVLKAGKEEVEVEWKKLKTAELKKKFLWEKNEDEKWKDIINKIK